MGMRVNGESIQTMGRATISVYEAIIPNYKNISNNTNKDQILTYRKYTKYYYLKERGTKITFLPPSLLPSSKLKSTHKA